nr:hypothetical protein [Tanacetum cinerariifolium]
RRGRAVRPPVGPRSRRAAGRHPHRAGGARGKALVRRLCALEEGVAAAHHALAVALGRGVSGLAPRRPDQRLVAGLFAYDAAVFLPASALPLAHRPQRRRPASCPQRLPQTHERPAPARQAGSRPRGGSER